MKDLAALVSRIRRGLERLEEGGVSDESAANVAKSIERELDELRETVAGKRKEKDRTRLENLRGILQRFSLRWSRIVR